MKNVPPGAYLSRIFVLIAASFALTLAFVADVGAQAGDEASATGDATLPAGTAATGTNPTNPSDPPRLITIVAESCTVSEGASVTLADGDGTEAQFIDGQQEIEITATSGEVRVEGPEADYIGDHASFATSDTAFDTDGDYTVVTSTGIACEGTGATTDRATTDQQARNDDDQGNANKQYGKGEVIKKSIVKGLPKTGGPSPLLLPWILALVAAGVAVIRRS